MHDCAAILLATYTYLYFTEIWWAYLQYCVHHNQNSFRCRFATKNCNILCLCSHVWQTCNDAIAFNIIAHSFGAYTFMQCSLIWCANDGINMRSEHVVNVDKMHCTLANLQNHCSAKITRNFFKFKKKSDFFLFKNDFRERRIPFCDTPTYVLGFKTLKFFFDLDYIRSGQKKILDKKLWRLHV